MAIPEHQLKTWSNQGATVTSASTYQSIKNCIDSGDWDSKIGKKTYLQGSYRNTTNIYGNSDVDIISELTSVYSYDTSSLDEIGKKAFDDQFTKATFTLEEYKKIVVSRLIGCFGSENVSVGKKAITVKGNGSRLDADVVVCNAYHNYKKNNQSPSIKYAKGILFYEEGTGNKIINYPDPHFENGVDKNSHIKTNGNLKKVTRIFKNMKARIVKAQMMSYSTAPSYFVECLIFNAANQHFRKTRFTDMVVPIINQFLEDDKSGENDKYVCQNYQRWLFGNGDQQWSKENARIFVKNLVTVWNNYPND